MRTFESCGSWARPITKRVPDDIDHRLWQLQVKLEIALDRIHDEALAKFRKLARSTGQRTRIDR